MLRKLATIQTIDNLAPIPGSDFLEVATVLGWSVVVKKGEHKVGDVITYCEVDSLLPERPEFEFLRKGSFKPAQVDPSSPEGFRRAGFRIKTVRLRGQISQGIVFALDTVFPGVPVAEFQVGDDVTDRLGIVKWEQVVVATGEVVGGFPADIPKTDEMRIQAIPALLERHRGRTFAYTEKVDGRSITVQLDEAGKLRVYGRNYEVSGEGVIGAFMKARNVQAGLATRPELAIQGEFLGPGVQGNKYKLKTYRFEVFNVFDKKTHKLLPDAEARVFVTQQIPGINFVRRLGTLVITEGVTVETLVDMAIGKSTLNPEVIQEGLVFRPVDAELQGEAVDPDLGRLSFKAINPEFLLKHDE